MVQVFYTLLSPFLAFFAAFAFLIYPNRAALHPNQAADWLATQLPASFNGPISIFRNWTYALFYTMAELWGSVVVSLLFWGFANEARRPTPRTQEEATGLPSADHPAARVVHDAGDDRVGGEEVLPALRPGGQRGAHLLGTVRAMGLRHEEK